MIQSERVQPLNDESMRGGAYVLYWMQASQRTSFNHALEHAVARANELRLPIVVGFGLMDDYPEANARHYAFMLEGLRDVAAGCRRRGIAFVIRKGPPEIVAVELARDAALVVCDRGYLRHQKQWREHVARHAGCPVVQVESDVVVPVQTASDKQEFAARTIRAKILKLRERFLVPLKPARVRVDGVKLELPSDVDVADPAAAPKTLRVDRGVPVSPRFTGGEVEGHKLLKRFVRDALADYPEGRREPSTTGTSMVAAYLHFGQLSPVEIALAVREAAAPGAAKEVYLEELIVRRELAVNFVHYQSKYDAFASVPEWARKTLRAHRRDKRYHVYSRAKLEAADTHDPYWNAAQREMNSTGFMHNSMRMYWGKKIIEWKRTPEEAFADALYLNNKYFLCGRDPNGYANVAWLFGLHDRPWGEREVFGTVRYMNAGGLERKFDMDAYVRMVEAFAR
jgi:deoxyribodipyrimidine photo-lyase